MCGFLAEYCYHDQNVSNPSSFEQILSLSKFRGPDHTGLHSDTYYQLGFNRLSILDLSKSANQPILSPSGRYHVVFNGEIYNYKEIAEANYLKNLRSSSDTEIIIQLIDKIGIEKTLNQLNGMFAITIVDTQLELLYATRDFAGIKPLFYGVSSQGLLFASQFDQIIKHPWFVNDLKLRPEIIKEYFGFGYMQSPNTIYEDIFQLNPGELIRCSRDGKIEKKTLVNYSLSLDPQDKISDSEFENKVHENLKSAVERQLRSDVPLASFLSGGIDSPLITAVAFKLRSSLKCFTVAVNDERLNEAVDAAKYAHHLGIHQIINKIDQGDLLRHIDQHFKGMPEPFGDYSSIPTFLITRLARENHTVMLSGDGGDELFYGYPRMLDVTRKRNWFKIPYRIRKFILRTAIKANLFSSWGPVDHKNIEEWIQSKHLHISNQTLDLIFKEIEYSSELKELYSYNFPIKRKNLLKWMRWCEFYGHMQRVLIKVDRMSMANGMEVRVPFLDGEIINLMNHYVPKKFSRSKHLKGSLKKLILKYYPLSIVRHKKKGFTVPINDWLRNELKDDLIQAVIKNPIYGEEIMNSDVLKSYVSSFIDGKHNSGWGVWIIYAWQKWATHQKLISN